MTVFDIRLVDAALEPQLLAEYRVAHLRALARAGYPPLKSSREQDWNTQECALLLAFDTGGTLIGGVRLQRHLPERPMPCAEVLRSTVVGFDDLLARDAADGGCGEACGLWVDSAYSGHGFVNALMLAVVSQARRWCGDWLWGISPMRLVSSYLDAGYQVCTELGNEGAFWYEVVDEESWILHVETATLTTLPHQDRALLTRLREEGKGERSSLGPQGGLNFRFDLI